MTFWTCKGMKYDIHDVTQAMHRPTQIVAWQAKGLTEDMYTSLLATAFPLGRATLKKYTDFAQGYSSVDSNNASYSDFITFSLYTGCHKSSKACYLDGCCCHCHIWNLLGYGLSCLRITLYNILQHWFRSNCQCQHNGLVQFCCQPICLRFVKSAIQGEGEGDDFLHLFRRTQGASYPGTSGHRACEQYNPSNPPDPHYRTIFHGSGSVVF